jgi:hypothetical protein
MKTHSLQLAIACFVFLAINAPATVRYVDVNNSSPIPPYTNWATAATVIQDAVDAAQTGDEIMVTNGTYAVGGRAVYGTMTNRVAVDKPLTLQSLNGPEVTLIRGYQVPGTTNENGAVRCVYLTNGATLVGFTLTNGATRGHPGGDNVRELSGGGVWCESTNAAVSNCVLTGNSAANRGGGAYNGTLNNCILSRNKAGTGGGASYGTLNNCTFVSNSASLYGGGAYSASLSNCLVTGNRVTGSSGYGGGASQGNLINCTLTSNSAWAGGGADVGNSGVLQGCTLTSNSASYGGGAYIYFGTLNNCVLRGNSGGDGGGANTYYGTLNNCTLTANSAGRGAGVWRGTLNNCIVYNTDIPGLNTYACTLNYCCAPDAVGVGNITNAPLFVDQVGGDLHLQTNSPCINAGKNAYAPAGPDLDGNPRIVGGTVDIGAYEFQSPVSQISYAWLQQYDLPINTNTDLSDADGDGMNNWQEWRTGTIPNNPSSLLQMMSPAFTNNPSGVTVSWQSVSGVNYFIQRGSDLLAQPAFSTIQTDIAGQVGTTSYTDASATNGGSYFYRVGVQ